jgi:hypothetical protein
MCCPDCGWDPDNCNCADDEEDPPGEDRESESGSRPRQPVSTILGPTQPVSTILGPTSGTVRPVVVGELDPIDNPASPAHDTGTWGVIDEAEEDSSDEG